MTFHGSPVHANRLSYAASHSSKGSAHRKVSFVTIRMLVTHSRERAIEILIVGCSSVRVSQDLGV